MVGDHQISVVLEDDLGAQSTAVVDLTFESNFFVEEAEEQA